MIDFISISHLIWKYYKCKNADNDWFTTENYNKLTFYSTDGAKSYQVSTDNNRDCYPFHLISVNG